MIVHKRLLALAGALLVNALAPCALAADSTSNAIATSSVGSNSKSKSDAGVATKCLGVITGAIVGVPVALVRMPLRENRYSVDSMSNGCKKLRVRIPLMLFWLPCSVAAGAFEAPWIGVGNAMFNYDKPFSKEQFSIVDSLPPNEPANAPSPTPPNPIPHDETK